MPVIEEVIREFGHFIQVDDLTFNDEGVIDLEIDSLGKLCIEEEKGAILVYLLKDYPIISGALCQKALSLCHPSENELQLPLYTGLIQNNQLLFALRIQEKELNFQKLNEAFQILENLHHRLN